MPFRRLLGLFAFFYVCLHLSVWVVLDHFFDWREMGADIVKRPYITVGMLAFSLLLPLAATSTTGMIKRLGAARWRRLHRLVYVAAGGGRPPLLLVPQKKRGGPRGFPADPPPPLPHPPVGAPPGIPPETRRPARSLPHGSN